MSNFVVAFAINQFFWLWHFKSPRECKCVDVYDQELSLAYGEDLMQCGRSLEAGLILSRAGKCERALTVFEDCLEWRHAVTVAARLNYTDLQYSILAKRLSSECLDFNMLPHFHYQIT